MNLNFRCYQGYQIKIFRAVSQFLHQFNSKGHQLLKNHDITDFEAAIIALLEFFLTNKENRG
jgi:hypothetical protein